MNDLSNMSTHYDPVSILKLSQTPGHRESKISKTASDFEAMLMTQLFQTLRKTVEPSGLFGDNQNARTTFEYLFDQAMFQRAADTGQTWGLAAKLEEVLKHQAQSKAMTEDRTETGWML